MSFNPDFIAPYSDHIDSLEEVYEAALEASKRLANDYIFLETGTRAGGSALAILQAIKDSGKTRWFFTIDPYGMKPYNIGNAVTTTLDYGEEYYRSAMKALADYAYENKLLHSHFRMKSLDWMESFDQSEFWYNGERLKPKFGFAYLDGDHDSKTVLGEYSWLSGHTPEVTVVVDDAHYLDNPVLGMGRVKNDRLFVGAEYERATN
jgi:predicted O-methyltransferase YrrM